jgi:hypothetical protein
MRWRATICYAGIRSRIEGQGASVIRTDLDRYLEQGAVMTGGCFDQIADPALCRFKPWTTRASTSSRLRLVTPITRDRAPASDHEPSGRPVHSFRLIGAGR